MIRQCLKNIGRISQQVRHSSGTIYDDANVFELAYSCYELIAIKDAVNISVQSILHSMPLLLASVATPNLNVNSLI